MGPNLAANYVRAVMPRLGDRVAELDPPEATRVRWYEVVIVAVLAGSVFAVHDLTYALRRPFWLDESWVALSTRAPISRLTLLTSSTPIGFSALLRAVPGTGDQRYRVIPLLFAVGTVVVAYLLGRQLRPASVLTGCLSRWPR